MPALTTLTPYAHPIIHEYAELTGYAFENEGPFSGALGRMLPLEKILEMQFKVPGVMIEESVFTADRIVIGYDDEKSALILHDPMFGPNWEISYDEFEMMWRAGDRKFVTYHPPNYEELARTIHGGREI